MQRLASVACVVAALSLGIASWILLRHRRRQRGKPIREAAMKRTRTEGEPRDELLQDFQGLVLKFHAATALVMDRPEEAQSRLNTALTQADQALSQARDALQANAWLADDLERDLLELAARLPVEGKGEDGPRFCVDVQGEKRELSNLAHEGVRRIASHAVGIAVSAVRAERVSVDIDYATHQFRLHVRTSHGFERAGTPPAHAYAGHYDFSDVLEQVRRIGGHLTVRSRAGTDIDVELLIPGSVAYLK